MHQAALRHLASGGAPPIALVREYTEVAGQWVWCHWLQSGHGKVDVVTVRSPSAPAGETDAVQVQRNPPPQISTTKYRVTNWPEYGAALVRRGSLTVWIAEEAVAAWQAPPTGKRGGQPIYSA